MQYLSLALYAEGPTDYRFLSPVLQRLCQDICLEEARGHVDIPEGILPLDDTEDMKHAPRAERILAAARQTAGAWRILFIHADGDKNPEKARAERVDPALRLLQQHLPEAGTGVGVVPVRETESWILADGNAIRSTLGTLLTDQALGLPPPGRIEQEGAPKEILTRVFNTGKPGARTRGQSETMYFQALGECISLAALRQLRSFMHLEENLREALRTLQIIQ